MELESDTDQSDEEVVSRDDEGEVAGSDVSSAESETEDENESDTLSDGERERDGEEGGVAKGRGFTAVALDRVQEDREKGKAVKQQISKSVTVLHH